MANANEIMRKITTKTVIGEVEKPKKDTILYHLIGQIRSMSEGSTEYGTYIKFKGTFEAERISDGVRLQSSTCIVPKPLDDELAVALLKAQEQDENAPVDFAVSIGVRPSTSPTGYDYYVESLIPMAKSDLLEGIRKQTALPAPKASK